jgi:hypothetical protein
MGIGLGIGVGIGRQRFAGGGGFADDYFARVLADGGTIEALSCVAGASALLQTASLLIIPSGYKAGVAYSALPNNGDGDLTWSRNSTANRKQSNGTIGSVGANVPRLDYSFGSCPAALLEPQRTNLALRSNEFNDASWSKSNLTAVDNSETGIDGNLSASLITTSAVGNFLFQVFTVTPGQVMTFTFYVKRGTMTDLKYRFRDQTNNVDVIPVTSYYSQTNATTYSRISVTLTIPAGCTSFRFSPIADTNSIGTCYITSAQVEVGSYATTYIPTTTATQRNADGFSISNVYSNGLIGPSGGTWFIQLRNNISYTRDGLMRIGIGDSTNLLTNSIWLSPDSPSGRYVILKTTGGSNAPLFTTTTDNVKIGIKWNGSTADVFVNGVKVVSATAFTTTVMGNLLSTAMTVPTFIQKMELYNTPLSDTELTTLTTL